MKALREERKRFEYKRAQERETFSTSLRTRSVGRGPQESSGAGMSSSGRGYLLLSTSFQALLNPSRKKPKPSARFSFSIQQPLQFFPFILLISNEREKHRQGAESKLSGKYPGSACGADVSSRPSALQVCRMRSWCGLNPSLSSPSWGPSSLDVPMTPLQGGRYIR